MAETVNGEITLDRIDAISVDANTVNGDISYDGPIRNGGRYSLSTHNGDITLTVAEGQVRTWPCRPLMESSSPSSQSP